MASYTTTYASPPLTDPRNVSGVRTRRMLAFLIDALVIAMLVIVGAVVIFFLGIITLGLGWMLYAILWPAMALIYTAFSLGGSNSATIGMRMMGLEMRHVDGSRMNPLNAAVHVILFYVSVTFLTPLILLISLISDRKRLLHDLVLGTVVVNRGL